jgi:drug/metabolite transporter (DMT)-like permease
MAYLLLVSLIWAFSFGLIKTNLTSIDPIVVTIIRLSIAALAFLPFFRPHKLSRKNAFYLLIIGGLEFGLMYMFYNLAFQYLKAYEVALFTISTPFFVALANSWFEKKWNAFYIITAIMAVIGTVIIKYNDIGSFGLFLGFFVVQLSNICFAIGQVLYRRVMRSNSQIKDIEVFALPYFSGALLAVFASAFFVDWESVVITSIQWWNLLYLGILASGLGFFLWNYGARRTNIGGLAIFNNLKIPLAITVSLLFFGEKTNLISLTIGGSIILSALVINEVMEKRRQIT